MKKTLLALTGLLSLATLTSCDKGNEYHSTAIYYPSSGRAMVYADQTADSLQFVSTESWQLTSNASWCTIPSAYSKFTNPVANALVEFSCPINFEPNQTGDWRLAIVTIGAGEYTTQTGYYQAPHLHLLRPGRAYNADGFPTELVALTDSATWTTDSVKFETFGSWTLQAQGELLEPLQTTGPAGTHTVRFALKPNTTDVQRTDTLLLTSRGVTDKIPVVQLPRKK